MQAHLRALALFMLAAATQAASSFDDFATDPNIAGAWTEYGYFSSDNTTVTWNNIDQDLDLVKTGSNGLGLYRTADTRLPTDTVTMTVKSLARTSGTWGFLGLMISAAPQPGYVTTTDDTYTLRMFPDGPGTFNYQYQVTRTYLDGTGDYILYQGASQAFAGPHVLEIARVGDHYEFSADGAVLYTTAVPAAGDFYNTAAKDSLVYYQVVMPGDGAMSATIDDFGVPPAIPALTLDGSTNGDSIDQGAPIGTLVGILNMENVPGGTHSFSLVAGAGDTDNGSFQIINNNELRTTAAIPADASVRIQGFDGIATTLTSAFAITYVPLPEPVQYWRLDDGAGATAANDIPTGNTGNLVGGPSWIAAGLEPALTGRSLRPSTAALDSDTAPYTYLDGGNINLTSTGASGDVTVSMWIKPSTLSGDPRILSQLTGSTGQAGAVGIGQGFGTGALWVWNGGGLVQLSSAGSVTTGSWQHLALVWNNGQVTAYLDGVAQLTGTANFNFGAGNGNFGVAAKYTGVFGDGFDGDIDEIAVFNVALTASQVASVANGTLLYTPTVTLDGSTSEDTISSNAPVGTRVGLLNLDNAPAGVQSFSLVAGAGDTDNGSFQIVNSNELRTTQLLGGDASVRIEGSVDGTPLVANAFTITQIAFPDPVQYWRLDDAAGASAANEIPAGNTGTIVGGPAWVTGGLDATLSARPILPSTAALDLSTAAPYDYIDGGNIGLTSNSGGGSVTVSMWLNPDSLAADDRLISQLSGATNQAGAVGENGGFGVGALWVWTGAGSGKIANAGALATSTWQHLALVWVNGFVTAYIDGVQQQSAIADFAFSAANFGIGGKYVGLYGDGFDGKFDEVAIFNVALSQQQITAIVDGGLLLDPPPTGTVIRFR